MIWHCRKIEVPDITMNYLKNGHVTCPSKVWTKLIWRIKGEKLPTIKTLSLFNVGS